ncbi:2782_t:CDS:2, partial [Entrophospora sp. SA101]
MQEENQQLLTTLSYYNQQCDTEITNYSLNEDLENDESHEYEDDENIKDLIIDEKIESENREYYINKIKDLIEESDLNVNYSMEKINSGEFSEVFKATHKITNKVIVIKSISIRDSKFLNILYNEVLISKVARHSNIIINYTQYIKKDHIYLLMEHCEFGSLYNIRNKKPNKKMNEKEVSFIVKEVLKGLNHLHSIGFIHRDIKAQNILVNSEGKIKIELLQNKIYSNKIDIWSLGITAVELFDGKPPWYPMNKNRVIELIKSVGLPPLPSNISPGFESYLKHSFTSNPENEPEYLHSRKKVNKKWFLHYTWLETEVINENTILFCKLCRNRNGSTQFALGTESLRLDGIKRHLNTHEHKESELQFLNSDNSESNSSDTLSEASDN